MDTQLEEVKEVLVEEPVVHDALESEKELKEWIVSILKLMMSEM